MRKSEKALLMTAALMSVLCVSNIWAAALMSESFDYELGELAGNSGGIGWGGAWTMTDSDGTATVVGGLSFSDYEVSGNAARITMTSNDGFKDVIAMRQVGINVTSGDLWVSFLYAQPDAPLASVASRTSEIRHGLKLRMKPKNSGSQGVAVDYGAGAAASGGWNVQSGETFMIVTRFADLGQAEGGEATMWVLSESHYDQIKAGGITVEELMAVHALAPSAPHSNRTLTTDDFVNMLVADSSNTSFSAVFDELNYGTSLSDVVVPEPATMLMFGFGIAGVFLKRNK
jgi:hypothetical protein